ncbi:TLC domain-containing protein 4-B isoform X1 [Huso huso]|uniref:TLC domain-containing protein 4-B isoform X1 n=1 Tax=Huso huso TaxID=61971 RepID=A0ABR0Y7X0_HUSHU
MFVLASPLLTALFCQGYGNVVPAKHTEWNSRLVSTVHALIVGTFCLYILWFDDAVNKDPVWGEPRLVKLNVAITCGYLVYDLLLLARYWKTMGDGFFVCHHIAALYAYGFVLSRGVLPYFANFRLLSELSTPFVNQRWFFEALSAPPNTGWSSLHRHPVVITLTERAQHHCP